MKILSIFFVFLFLFSMGFVSAEATQTASVPDIALDFEDYASFDYDSFFTGFNDSFNTLSFTNPDTGAGVVLWGDTGGEHTNSRFTINLDTAGFVQITSYSVSMSPITVTLGVSDEPSTQAGDSFLLSVSASGVAPSQIASLGTQALSTDGYVLIDWRDYFSNFDNITLDYYDRATVSMVREIGDVGSVSNDGNISVTLTSTLNSVLSEFESLGQDYSSLMTVTARNSYGSASLSFTLTSLNSTSLSVGQFDYVTTYDLSPHGSNTPRGIWTNGSDFWQMDSGDDVIYHLNMTFGLIDFINVSGIFGIGSGLFGNNSELYATETGDSLFVFYHNGTVKREIDMSPAGISSPRGVWSNGSDFWVIDATDDDVYHLDWYGNLISNWDYQHLGTNFNGIYGNATSLWLSDTSDDTVHRVSYDGTNEVEYTIDTYDIGYLTVTGTSWYFLDEVNDDVHQFTFTTTADSGSVDSPQQIASILPFELVYNQQDVRYISDYFLGYSNVTVSVNGVNITRGINDCGTDESDLGVVSVTLGSSCASPLVFTMLVTAGTTDYTGFLDILVFSESGSASVSVPLTISASGYSGSSSGLLDTLINSMNTWFPDADTLSLSQRMTYVMVAMLFLAIIVMLGTASLRGGVSPLVLWILAFLEIGFFLYFVSISYIPVVILVVPILLTILFVMLRAFK